MRPKPVVGQELYFAFSDVWRRAGQRDCSVTVTKVGTKYSYLSNGFRINNATWKHDQEGYSDGYGACYLSEEHWNAEQLADVAWRGLKRRIEYGNRPNGVTAADIERAAKHLGLEEET